MESSVRRVLGRTRPAVPIVGCRDVPSLALVCCEGAIATVGLDVDNSFAWRFSRCLHGPGPLECSLILLARTP